MKELLRNIDTALARMEAKGHAETIHYMRLKAKRDAIANGEPYATYNITPYLIRAMGAQIPNINFGKDGKFIKPRGDWRKHVAPAGRQICERNGGTIRRGITLYNLNADTMRRVIVKALDARLINGSQRKFSRKVGDKLTKEYTILKGDCLDRLKELPDNSVDSVVTDPPYGLSKEPDIVEVLTKWLNGEPYDHGHGGFMGKRWDSFVPHPDIWREVYRVLKPGGHALVFAGTRTQDLMTIALRLAGFEVRDVIEWLYFSGFPKSLDVSKAFDKRAGAEREVVGYRNYTNQDIRGNAYKDTERTEGRERLPATITAPATELAKKWDGWGTALKPAHEPIIVVRKPLIDADTGRKLTVVECVEKYGTGAINIDGCRIEMSEEDFIAYKKKEESFHNARRGKNVYGGNSLLPSKTIHENKIENKSRFPANCITLDDDAFYSKYFNISPAELSKKASKKDRNSDWRGEEIALRNTHPTVKPTELMAWLVRLVTPPGGIVLDPFAGSGSTLVAAKREGFGFIGIEREEEYVEIIEARTGEVAQ